MYSELSLSGNTEQRKREVSLWLWLKDGRFNLTLFGSSALQ